MLLITEPARMVEHIFAFGLHYVGFGPNGPARSVRDGLPHIRESWAVVEAMYVALFDSAPTCPFSTVS